MGYMHHVGTKHVAIHTHPPTHTHTQTEEEIYVRIGVYITLYIVQIIYCSNMAQILILFLKKIRTLFTVKENVFLIAHRGL